MNPVERRAPGGRIVYSRGPIIRGLEVFNALVGLAAIAALIVSLTSLTGRLDTIERARESAARDSCQLLRGLVFTATPNGKLARAEAYIRATPLHNCDDYARGVLKGK